MRKSVYLRERKILEAEELRLATDLSCVQERIKALDKVWTEIFNNKPQVTSVTPVVEESEQEEEGEEQTHKDVTLMVDDEGRLVGAVNGHANQAMIDQAAWLQSGVFGVKDIEEQISRTYTGKVVNRTTIAWRLRKLVDEGKLEEVEAGRGRRPGTFRRKYT